MVPVTTSDVNSDGTTMVNGASAGSRQRSCGSQHTCLCSIAQAVLEQSCSAAQHAGECQYSTARSTRARSSCVRSDSSAHSPARPPLSLSAADTGQDIDRTLSLTEAHSFRMALPLPSQLVGVALLSLGNNPY